MKRIILVLAVMASMFSCKNDNGLTGKWHMVDMKSNDPSQPAPMPEAQMKEEALKENMVFEFTADGTCKVTMADLKPSSAKYTKDGNTLTMTDSSGKKSMFEIENMTPKGFTLKSTEMKISFVLEKM